MGDSVEPHVCEVCYHNYNERSRIPKVLTCGHTYCLSCVREMFNHGASILTCPVCRVVTRSRLARVSTNFQLLRVIKEQKLLCTEEDVVVPVSDDNAEPMINEEIDDGVFAMMKHFEAEVNTLKALTSSIGLNFAHCFPNTKFISGTLPETEDNNTLSAIMNGVNRIHSTYTGVCFLLRKAKRQNELVSEQMTAGTAKKLPNGGVELKHQRPNGQAVDDHDLLYPPAPGSLFDPPDDDDSWNNDDAESYSAESNFLGYRGDLAEDFDNMMWLSANLPDGLPSDNDEQSNHSTQLRYCDVCYCQVPPGANHARIHENGRRHQNNLERRNQGLPPENPQSLRGRRGGRGGRGRGRGIRRPVGGDVGWPIAPFDPESLGRDLFLGGPSNGSGSLFGGVHRFGGW